ncbi:hypothetical protein MRB53_039286 [Persea americana]|nr:hypothetical protein MRB53_039286 [Persea americana]
MLMQGIYKECLRAGEIQVVVMMARVPCRKGRCHGKGSLSSSLLLPSLGMRRALLGRRLLRRLPALDVAEQLVDAPLVDLQRSAPRSTCHVGALSAQFAGLRGCSFVASVTRGGN